MAIDIKQTESLLCSWDRVSLYMMIIQLTNEMQLTVLFIGSNTLHVTGVTRPSSGAPDDGRGTPETCRVLISIKSTISCISLVNDIIIKQNLLPTENILDQQY